VSNFTKEWSRVVLEIGVGYEEDVDRVMAVLAEVGRCLTEDEAFGKLVLEPPQVLGVEALTDSQVTIRMLAKTVPFKQWDVGGDDQVGVARMDGHVAHRYVREVARELRRRIKSRFDREGIRAPHPHHVVITHSADTGGS
jgi:small conductance mechanosensitive channel